MLKLKRRIYIGGLITKFILVYQTPVKIELQEGFAPKMR